ncbi:7,8-dihydro-6-hydroxymethylpterin dimethyltransferase [uncultured archaeon]|nr:7,8-dihydro-6-hydroxymethylpterin dimethyltransferase [uncultured archaeon]
MLQSLRQEKPLPCPAVQFSGGEPTLRPDLPEIISLARSMGFSQIQIATNGLCMASSLDLCRTLERSGLNTVYLQFDGITPEPYQAIRGRDIFPQKLQALQNFRSAGLASACLVPTLARGINDHQVGAIVRFASQNLDVVRGVNFQPVAFTGRIEAEERASKRITIPDLLALVEEQTQGEITREDFYPVPFVDPISRLLEEKSGASQPAFTVHPCCGAATYVFSHNGRLIPINRFIDVEGLMELIDCVAESYDGSRLGVLKLKGKMLRELPKFVDESIAPGGLNVTRMLLAVFRSGTRDSIREFHKRTLFLGAMHFQDLYNLDLERLQRCGVHYATPDGRIIPFCSYNILHRKRVEEKFSRPQKP